MVILEFDGLFRGIEGGAHAANKCGFMCYGWLVRKNGKIVAQGHGTYLRCDDATSNVAEYLALIEGLEALWDMALLEERVLVIGDAKTIINQMKGLSRAHVTRIRKLQSRAQRIAKNFRDIEFLWVPRRENHAADKLSRRALKQFKISPDLYRDAIRTLNHERRKAYGKARLLSVHDLRILTPQGAILQRY
ncbi:MAG: ribonuclease HI family protein [Anaerolineae bacterium]|nr:ribonuclease HI family protein [Anaerolineae bacterium]